MPTVFTLIDVELGAENEVVEKLRKMKNVKEAHAVHGVHDIIAKVEADTMEELKEILTSKVRRLDKVRTTLTMIVIESREK